MKYLGIDFGTKRVGVAISDDSGMMAFPHSVIKNDTKLLSAVLKAIDSENIGAVVIGDSKNSLGKQNEIMKHVDRFVEKLEKQISLPIFFEGEFFTTDAARKIESSRDTIDAQAAAIILQRYLDRFNHE